MLQISTNNLKDRKKVEIDGHPYTVRQFGAGEQLAINQLVRQVSKFEKKLEAGTLTEAEEKKAEKISNEMIDKFTALFDDGEDGSKSKALVSSLNTTELPMLFSQIFGEEDEPESS